MKIYTRTGDDGTTGLYGKKRLAKHHIRIESYGTVDELNSWIGLLADESENISTSNFLRKIQVQLFNIGSHLASDEDSGYKLPDIQIGLIQELEDSIDKMNEELEPLKTFILPGGHVKISHCHIARTVCRRAERRIVHLAEQENVDNHIVKVLNRLSDYLFVLSRYIAFELKTKEIPWDPKL